MAEPGIVGFTCLLLLVHAAPPDQRADCSAGSCSLPTAALLQLGKLQLISKDSLNDDGDSVKSGDTMALYSQTAEEALSPISAPTDDPPPPCDNPDAVTEKVWLCHQDCHRAFPDDYLACKGHCPVLCPTIAPTVAPTAEPTMTPAPSPPTAGKGSGNEPACHNYCATKKKSWAKKCSQLNKKCSACPECVSIAPAPSPPPACRKSCAKPKKSWAKKCSQRNKQCSACSDCNAFSALPSFAQYNP